MDLLNTVNQWIEKARDRIANDVQIPLIEYTGIDMTNELVDAWTGDDAPLREALENVLSVILTTPPHASWRSARTTSL